MVAVAAVEDVDEVVAVIAVDFVVDAVRFSSNSLLLSDFVLCVGGGRGKFIHSRYVWNGISLIRWTTRWRRAWCWWT